MNSLFHKDVCKYMNFNEDGMEYVLVKEQENPEENQFNNEDLKIKNENQNYSECSADFLTNYAGLKTNTPKTENDSDIIYEDKPELCGGKSVSKSEVNSDSDFAEGPSFPHELSIDFLQQNTGIEEDGTDVKNDTRKEPTSYNNSNIGQGIHKKNHNLFKYSGDFFSSTFKSEIHGKVRKGKKPFQCKICSKLFAQKYNFLRHERIHTGTKPFQCKICSKSFSQKHHFSLHERVHTEENPLQCQMCSKSFANKSALVYHERVHAGEKPFQCKICSKLFTSKANLDGHIRIHTGEKPFQCKICLNSFSTKQKLERHIRIHTGEKPFQCKICLKSFADKRVLKTHETIHTGEKPFQCKVCSKSFVQSSSLFKHKRVHAEEK